MVKNRSAITDFIDAISDEKLKNFVSSQKTIVKKGGFRLDHQGVNKHHPHPNLRTYTYVGESGRFR